MASRLEVIRSNKGHHKVIHLGFMYTKHKAMGDKIRWRCVQRGAHCKGSIFTSNEFREPRVTVNHNHMPDFNAVEFARSRTMFAERLAMFHPLEVVELNREAVRGNTTRLKQEQSERPGREASRGIVTRVKQEPLDSNGFHCASSRDLPSTSGADGFYASNSFLPSRPTRKTQAPQQSQAPPKPKPELQQQQQLPQPLLKRPVVMKPLAPKPRPVSPPQPPPPPPEVCLRWNSYHSNMQATFPALLNNEQFVDVTLACEGRSIKCHKIILSACSSYFDELLSQNPCQHPIVLMKDLKFWEVQALVDFMYRGEVNVGQDKLPFLLAAAEALQIKGLASPTSGTPSHDDDSMSLGMDGDYLDDLDVPSPSSARRSRKRRTIAVMPTHQPPPVPPSAPAPTFRSARLQRNNNHHSLSQPSTSGYMAPAQEPPTRKRRLDGPEFEVNDHIMREIKLEPVDIDASSDSMDQSAELFQVTCDPSPGDLTFHTTNDPTHDDMASGTVRGNAASNLTHGDVANNTAHGNVANSTAQRKVGSNPTHDNVTSNATGNAAGETTPPKATSDTAHIKVKVLPSAVRRGSSASDVTHDHADTTACEQTENKEIDSTPTETVNENGPVDAKEEPHIAVAQDYGAPSGEGTHPAVEPGANPAVEPGGSQEEIKEEKLDAVASVPPPTTGASDD